MKAGKFYSNWDEENKISPCSSTAINQPTPPLAPTLARASPTCIPHPHPHPHQVFVLQLYFKKGGPGGLGARAPPPSLMAPGAPIAPPSMG